MADVHIILGARLRISFGDRLPGTGCSRDEGCNKPKRKLGLIQVALRPLRHCLVEAAAFETSCMSQRQSESEATVQSCPICGSGTEGLFILPILRKHQASLHQCPRCGWAGFPDPHWLDEAYQEPIAITDTGLLARNISISRKLSTLLCEFDLQRMTILDVAGGYGVLTRMMRDIGHQCYWSDAYSPNIFAKGFEEDQATGPIDVITLFEVLEHLPHPVDFLRKLKHAHHPKIIIASTELYADQRPRPDWWYLSPETGQHIAFYTTETLRCIASTIGLTYGYCRGFHVFARPDCSEAQDMILRASARPSLLRRALARFQHIGHQILPHHHNAGLSSLTWSDHLEAVKRLG